jgi:hypothetical protein
MLGYTMNDLDNMTRAIDVAYKYVSTPDDLKGLEQANEFLQGLWAEGYFDNA